MLNWKTALQTEMLNITSNFIMNFQDFHIDVDRM